MAWVLRCMRDENLTNIHLQWDRVYWALPGPRIALPMGRLGRHLSTAVVRPSLAPPAWPAPEFDAGGPVEGKDGGGWVSFSSSSIPVLVPAFFTRGLSRRRF